MSKEAVVQFLKKVEGDPALQAELKAASESQEPMAAIVAAAARYGFSFTPEEFNLVQNEAGRELTDEELGRVAGGAVPLRIRSFR